MANKQLSDGGTDGTTVGQSAADKVGFHGVAPIAQAALTTAPVATASTSTTPFGYTQAQADAIVAWIRAADTALRNKGLIT